MAARRLLWGGPIALVEEGDLIRIDVPNRQLAIVGGTVRKRPPKRWRLSLPSDVPNWKPKALKYTKGPAEVLISSIAVSPMKGAYME